MDYNTAQLLTNVVWAIVTIFIAFIFYKGVE